MIVPDLARGLALAGIAMANAIQAWMINDANAPGAPGWTLGGVRPGSTVDQVAAVLSAMFVHVRGLPMFSTLLGFGIGLIGASLNRKGYPPLQAKITLVRRYALLALFGLIHMFVFFHGDIMLYYGLIGVVVAMMITLRTKTLRIVAYLALMVHALISTLGAVGMYFYAAPKKLDHLIPTAELVDIPSYFSANATSAFTMFLNAPYAVIQLGGLVLLGYVWAREGYLQHVGAHRRELWTWVVVGAVICVGIGVPWGLAGAGVIDPVFEQPLFMANLAWGLFTGPGILAALALATNSVQRGMHERAAAGGSAEAPAWAYPFVALGKRSMSGYLAQTLLFIVLVTPMGLGLGLGASISEKLLVGLMVWVITLALAVLMEHAGIAGPFEQMHRRLAYGPTKRLEPYAGPMARDAHPEKTPGGPSVKDGELYEKLREEGNSKSKAAAIANAAANEGRSAVGEKGGKAGSYEDWTKDELYQRAQELGIEGRSTMTKDELIEALRD